MRRSSVLFPEPLGPIIVTTSPRFTEKFRPQRTRRRPYAFQTSAHTTNGRPASADFRVAATPATFPVATATPAAPCTERDAAAGAGASTAVTDRRAGAKGG